MNELYNAYFIDGKFSSMKYDRTDAIEFSSEEEKDSFIKTYKLKYVGDNIYVLKDGFDRVRIGKGPKLTVDGMKLEKYVARNFKMDLYCDLLYTKRVFEFTQYSDYEVYITSNNCYYTTNEELFYVLLEKTPLEHIKRVKANLY